MLQPGSPTLLKSKERKVTGRVHSIESCGTVDGPGIRFVLFLQGCLMRCKYCHNRDTWDLDAGKDMSVDDVMAELKSCRRFFKSGGITVSGGEALLQIEFVTELFRACKAEGIHTCLDTNGYIRHCKHLLDPLLDVTDLVMLDLKQMDPQKHIELTRTPNTFAIQFAHILHERHQPTWIRHVVVPGYTDDEASLKMLADFVKNKSNISRVELLPYHKMGCHKWKAFGDRYPLEGVEPPPSNKMDAIVQLMSQNGVKAVY
ncbi:MAG: pyruvate formate lyase 1-activating protein [Opitutales bacterium]